MPPDFPFAFAKDLQTGSIDDQMLYFTTAWRFYTDVNALADQGVVRAAQWQVHQLKNRVNETL